MAFTPRSKILGATLAAVVVVGGLSYANYQNTKQIANLTAHQIPVVVTKVVEVTPTTVPTATPAGSLKFVPRASSVSATKGVAK